LLCFSGSIFVARLSENCQNYSGLKNLVLYIYLLFGIIGASYGQENIMVPDGIRQAIISGNSKKLAVFFSQNVELLIKNTEDVYSKAQAEIILKDFFSKNTPDSFTVEIEGESDGISYAIGNLSTTGGKYRIYLAYQIIHGKSKINRLNISTYD